MILAKQQNQHEPSFNNSSNNIDGNKSNENANGALTTDNSDNDSITIDIDKLIESKKSASCSQLIEEKKEENAVVSVDVEETSVHYQEQSLDHQNHSEEDDDNQSNITCSSLEESSSPSSLTSSDVEDDHEVPIDNLKERGWLEEVPQPPTNQLQHIMNGVTLPNGEGPNIHKLTVNKSSNVFVGNRALYKGPVTIKQFIYANSTSVNEGDNKLETDCIESSGDEYRDKNGICKNESIPNGPKLSTSSSDHPLYPFSRGKIAEWFGTKRCTIFACTIAVILVIITGLIVWLTVGTGTEFETVPPFAASPNDSSINNGDLQFVTRFEWGAKEPDTPLDKLKILPPPYVIIHHTATPRCSNREQCSERVRSIQEYHMVTQDFGDIGYNFLIGDDGSIYVGRGWDIYGAHCYGFNSKSLGIAFIGSYSIDQPTKLQMNAALKLLEYSVEQGKLAKDYKVLGYKQVTPSDSPGNNIYEVIRTWDHWSPNP